MDIAKPLIDDRQTAISMVFSVIRQHAPLPRIDIAKSSGLSPATVTSITAGLIAKGLIEEVAATGPRAGLKRGRPRVDLKIRGAAHLIAGMKFTDQNATVIIVDYEGQPISEFARALPTRTMPTPKVIEFIEQTLILALAETGRKTSDLSGVGIGIAGIVDAPQGYVFWSPNLAERNVPLQQMLREKIGVPVFLENDANLVAIAEQRFGLGKTARNFIVISIEQGVGMGIVIDGKLYRGNNGCGAEFGHTKVHLDGALCRCGQRGCLEAYVGDYALLREAGIAIDLSAGKTPKDQMKILLEAARTGNPHAKSIIDRAGRMFAMGLANVVNLFAPELIILSGDGKQYNYHYNAEIIAEMKKSIIQVNASQLEVVVHKWGDKMWAIGAAAYAIDGVDETALREDV